MTELVDFPRARWWWALVLVAGCSVDPSGKDLCNNAADCLSGNVCVSGRCLSAVPDAEVGDRGDAGILDSSGDGGDAQPGDVFDDAGDGGSADGGDAEPGDVLADAGDGGSEDGGDAEPGDVFADAGDAFADAGDAVADAGDAFADGGDAFADAADADADDGADPDTGLPDSGDLDAGISDDGVRPDAGILIPDGGLIDAGAPPFVSGSGWSWGTMPSGTTRRFGHTALWTGREMFVFGGRSTNFLNTASLYAPKARAWRAASILNGPSGRAGVPPVWTGSEVFIWGGFNSTLALELDDGALYSPSLDRWRSVSTIGRPTPRSGNAAVWTGGEVVVFGGTCLDSCMPINNVGPGARYNPSTNRWAPMSTVNQPDPVGPYGGVWSGTEVLLVRKVSPNNGGLAAYSPFGDSWRPIAPLPAPLTELHHLLWLGTEMFGIDDNGQGAAYDPALDSWRLLSPSGLTNIVDANWTGAEVLVRANPGGAHYDPVQDSWTPFEDFAAPPPATPSVTPPVTAMESTGEAVWSGAELLIWAFDGQVNRHYGPDPSDYPGCDGGEAPLTVELTAPQARTVQQNSSLNVVADIDSSLSISTVEYFLDGTSFGQLSGTSGTIDLTGAALGPHTVRVVVVDAGGSTACHLRTIYVDGPPSVSLTEPEPNRAAYPTIRVRGTCTDNNGPCTLYARAGTETAFGGYDTGTLETTFDLSAYDGQSVVVTVEAVDSVGLRASASRTVYPETSPRLVHHGEADGTVCDVDTSRILFLVGSPGAQSLISRELATGIDTPITVAGSDPDCALSWLAPGGAFFTVQLPSRRVYQWQNGTLISHGSFAAGTVFKKGDWAVVRQGTEVRLHDLVAGAYTPSSVNVASAVPDVAPTGLVIYQDSSNRLRTFDGTNTIQITAPAAGLIDSRPRSDGTLTVFRRQNVSNFEIVLFNGSSEEILTTSRAWTPLPITYYDAVDGYTAFIRPDFLNVNQILLRSPAGAISNVTNFAVASTLEGLGDGGTLVYARQGARYHWTPTTGPVDLQNTTGRLYFRDGELYVVIGDDVFRYVP